MNPTDFIKSMEGLRLCAYKDGGGVWTIGYGSTGADIKEGTIWSERQCEDRLTLDLLHIGTLLDIKVKVPLNPNQKCALISLVYNIGINAFKNSTLLFYLNNGDFDKASLEFDKWIKDNGKIVHGLVVRREKEKELFLS